MSIRRLVMKHVICGMLTTWILASIVLLPAAIANAAPSESLDSIQKHTGVSEAAGHETGAYRSLAGRHRLEFRMGYWDTGRHQKFPSYMYTEGKTRIEDLLGAFCYSYWAYDNFAADITFRGLVVEVSSIDRASSTSEDAVIVTSAIFGARFYPISSAQTPLRPYFIAGFGPYIGIESNEVYEEDNIRTAKSTKTLATFGGFFGGGLDIQMGRHLMMGVHMGYNLISDFPEPLGSKNNFSGMELSAGISLLL